MSISDFKRLIQRVSKKDLPEQGDLEKILDCQERECLRYLFFFADSIKRRYFKKRVVMRGVVEFSNYCVRSCFYCGLNKDNRVLRRYRLDKRQILDLVGIIFKKRINTVILQSGDDFGISPIWLKEIISEIKRRFNMVVTLSVGERSFQDYKMWRDSGADRYLLKIETSHKRLYESIHLKESFQNRIRCLNDLITLDYQVGSGNIVGLPGQTVKMLAEDILFFYKNNFDMIAIGPFCPHPQTRFARKNTGDYLMVLKMIALTRIVTKDTYIPATTALGNLDRDYRSDALKAGANVLMANFTPLPYRNFYQIYPRREISSNSNSKFDNLAYLRSLVKKIKGTIDYKRNDRIKEDSYVSHSF